MERKLGLASLLVSIVGSFILSACDNPPSPPLTANLRRADVLVVPPDDSQERTLATTMQAASSNYQYRLQVIQAYYMQIGNMDKYVWTQRELANLQRAQTFRYEGIPDVQPPAGESVENADERLLAEYAVSARNDYQAAVAELLGFYEKEGNTFKASLIRNMRDRYDPVRTYMYYLGAEVPPADLKPTEVIPEAEEMFAKAYKLFRDGKGFLRFALTTSYGKERQALLLFRDLVRRYPRSTKIALAAYYIGDIYKEYFDEDVRAVLWYERAVQWDPNITEPARFQAAVLYDIRLHNHAKALELYKGVIQHEQFNSSNVDYARGRIEELTAK